MNERNRVNDGTEFLLLCDTCFSGQYFFICERYLFAIMIPSAHAKKVYFKT